MIKNIVDLFINFNPSSSIRVSLRITKVRVFPVLVRFE